MINKFKSMPFTVIISIMYLVAILIFSAFIWPAIVISVVIITAIVFAFTRIVIYFTEGQ